MPIGPAIVLGIFAITIILLVVMSTNNEESGNRIKNFFIAVFFIAVIALVLIAIIKWWDFLWFWFWLNPGYMPLIPGFMAIIPTAISFIVSTIRFSSIKEGIIALVFSACLGPGAWILMIAIFASSVQKSGNWENYEKTKYG